MTTVAAERHPTTVAASRQSVRVIGRIGIGSRGVIYLILAYLALDIARHGSAPAQANSTGALEEIGHRGGGPALLLVLALGLGSYALWRLFDAAVGGGSTLRRLGSVAIAVVYFGLLGQAVKLAIGHRTSGGASANPQPLVARVLGWPGGQEMVGAGGAALVAAGIALALWGMFHRHSKNLALERVSNGWRKTIRLLGALGDLTRGFLLALVGVHLLATAVSGSASEAKGVDQALKNLVHHPYGAILIGAVAFGLLCYAAYSFCEASLRRL